jgi:hypothetical protein
VRRATRAPRSLRKIASFILEVASIQIYLEPSILATSSAGSSLAGIGGLNWRETKMCSRVLLVAVNCRDRFYFC